jgi:hypothetical protein
MTSINITVNFERIFRRMARGRFTGSRVFCTFYNTLEEPTALRIAVIGGGGIDFVRHYDLKSVGVTTPEELLDRIEFDYLFDV